MPFPEFLQTPPPAVPPDPFLFPTTFVQGDRLQYRIQDTAPHASADGWTYVLALRLENAQAPLTYSSTEDAGNFLIQVDATVTATWTDGRYQVQLTAVNGTIRETVMEAFLQVLPKLAATGVGDDLRSHARRTLDLLEALIEGRATNDIIESVIDNTRFMRMNFTELVNARNHYRLEVRSEEAKARAKAGLGTGRLVLNRFVSPM